LVSIKPTESLSYALQVLSHYQVIASPIIDGDDLILRGFVDSLDILTFLLHAWTTQSLSYKLGIIKQLEFDSLMKTHILKVASFSLWNFPIKVKETASIKEILDILSSEHFYLKTSRIAIVNSDDVVINLLTLADVIGFVSNVLPMKSSLRALDIVRRPISVTLDTLFGDVVRLLFDNRIKGLAVVDNDGKLIGSLSASDIASIQPKDVSAKLFETNLSTLFDIHTLSRRNPILCTEDSPLTQVVNTMYNHKIQRVYITDSSSRPIGIITINDILRALKPI